MNEPRTTDPRNLTPWRWPLLLLLPCLLAAWLAPGSPAHAQAADDAATARAIETEIDRIKQEARSSNTAEQRLALLARARATLAKSTALQDTLATPIEQVRQRIEQLGPDAAKSPDAAVREQQLELNRELATHVALDRRAALSRVEAAQAVEQLNQAQARAFGEELFKRAASPLAPSLWATGIAALRDDLARTPGLDGTANAPAWPWPLLLAALGAAVVALAWAGRPIHDAAARVGMALSERLAGRDPAFSRALFAVWTILITALLASAAALLALAALHAAGVDGLPARLLSTLGVAIVIGLYVRSTALAILQPANPAWRMWTTLDNSAATAGLQAGTAIAGAIALVVAVEGAAEQLEPGPGTLLFAHSALALVSTALLAWALHRAGAMRRSDVRSAEAADSSARSSLALVIGLGWLALVLLALFGMLGYVNLANRLSQWAIWGAVVVLTTSILLSFVDGLCRFMGTARSGALHGAQPSLALQQASVLLSAVCRLLLLALACGALLVPFGAGFTSILELLSPLATGFEVGGITVSAAALLRALLAFVVVVALVRFLRSWINNSYFPTTGLQPDARDSIDKIVRYLGVVLGLLWALTAFGVGMEKVAILASALSVGIGFGLQAITQNFVSGLILLVERPVRIGDWVRVNDVEGDIRRINVRSTEIRVGDHSTMIVPNSELITKVVQNKTMGHSLGRAQILLSVPLETDLDQAIDAVAATLAADDEVLDSPAPAVFLDRVEGGMAVLNCFVHVRSPRIAYSVRSRVTLAALRTLRGRGVPAMLPAQQFTPSPSPPA